MPLHVFLTIYCAQVGFENVFVFLWATGRLSYMPDAEAFHTIGEEEK